MRKKGNKSKHINMLLEAMQEAEELGLNYAIHGQLELKKLIEQYLNKEGSHEEMRQQLFAELKDGAALTGEHGIRRKLGAFDLEFFGKAYFPHYFSKPSPGFHRDLDKIWNDGVLKRINPNDKKAALQVNQKKGCRRAVAAPRGHAKSTNLTFKDDIHAICYQYKHYILILSDSGEQAEGFLESIRAELEENEAIREDFGDMVGSKVWRNNVLLTSAGIKIEAIGSGKKVRGRKHRNWRPDLIVLDDVENDENVRTAEQRKKLYDWFTKAVSKAGDGYTDIVVIGTLLHYDSLLAKILKNSTYNSIKYKAVLSWATATGLWTQWEEIYSDLSNDNREEIARLFFEEKAEEMLEGTSVLWEAKNSYYDLMVQRLSDGPAAFNSELQNEPINPEDCIFLHEWFDFYNDAEIDFSDGNYLFFGFVDPSLGKTKTSDTSAIIILAKHKTNGFMYVEAADIMRRHPDQIIKDILEHEIRLRRTYKRGFKKFGAETNQFQWFLAQEIKKASAKAGLYIPMSEVNQTSNKVMRVQTLQPDIKNGYIKLNRRHHTLLEQLEQFPMGAYDDGPDALEGCRTLAKSSKKFHILDRGRIGL